MAFHRAYSNELTSKIIGVRITQSQVDHLECEAEKNSMTVSQYIRKLIEKDKARMIRAEKNAKAKKSGKGAK